MLACDVLVSFRSYPSLQDESTPLQQSSVFVSGPRSRTDFSWAVIFWVAVVAISSTGLIFIPSANFFGLERYDKAATSVECFNYLNISNPFGDGTGIEIASGAHVPGDFDYDNTNGVDNGDPSGDSFLRVSR